jgi:hypothetical protein
MHMHMHVNNMNGIRSSVGPSSDVTLVFAIILYIILAMDEKWNESI